MPLGKVFDAREGQVLISPVSNFYQGKAMRAGLKQQEQEMRLADEKMDLARRGMDVDERMAGLRESGAESESAKAQREMILHAAAASMEAYESNPAAPEEERREAAFEASVSALDLYMPGSRDEVLKHLEASGEPMGAAGFDPEETMALLTDPDRFFAGRTDNRRTLGREEVLALPGMTPARAANAVVQQDDSGQIFIDDAPTGLTAEDLKSRGVTRETPAARDKLAREREATTNLLGETAIALNRNREFPGATGMLAAGQEAASGLPGPVGDMADAVGEQFTGHTAAEIATVRTQARTLAAQMISTITGEESGRYTKEEQQIARDTEAQLSLWRNSDQVEAGLGELQAIKIRGELRTRGTEFIASETGKEINILTDEGFNEWGNILMNQFGLSEEKAFEELEFHEQIMIIKARK